MRCPSLHPQHLARYLAKCKHTEMFVNGAEGCNDECDVERIARHSKQIVWPSAVTSPGFLGSGHPVYYQCTGTMSTWQEIHYIS